MKQIIGFTITAAILVALLITLGCSSSGSPVNPGIDEPANPTEADNSAGTSLWGAWNVVIDTETETVDITQVRQADGSLNVVSFLEPPALANLSIANLQLLPSQNRVNVDVLLTHPFKTSSGIYHGFDVKGVVFGPALLNADGKTGWMNPADFSSAAYGYTDGLLGTPDSIANYTGSDWGYKYFADGLGKNASVVSFFSNSSNLNNRGMFSEGATNTRHYQLDFGTPSKFLIFNYAVVANHAWPSGTPPYGVNDYPVATANGQEAFCIEAYEITNNLWYDPVMGIGGGTLDLDVEVWDWQGLGNTSATVSTTFTSPVMVSSFSTGSTSYSGTFSFTGLSFAVSSTNPIKLIITATDSSATFGSAWFQGLLPSSHAKYNTSVYTIIDKQVNIATAGNYYQTTSVKDFTLWAYPHQSANCSFSFVDYYNFTGPPYGRHDICVIPGPGLVKVIDTAGAGPAGPPPPGGGIIYDIPLPLGSAPEIPAPYFSGGAASPPNLFQPWEPTRFDSNSHEFETAICSANMNPYIASPTPAPEYSIQQIYHIPPGAGGPPFLLDVDPFAMFPGAMSWDIGVDVSNGFFNTSTSTFGSLYGMFFFDYMIWQACGYPIPAPGPPQGTCWVYELPLPAAGIINVVGLPTSAGACAPGPNFIDDSSNWGVCGSLAIDSQPQNQPGISLPNPTLVYILDSEGDIEIWEVDFATGQNQQYGCIANGFAGAGYMAADIEMIDANKLAGTNPLGYVPNTNMLAVAMVDGNLGSSQGDWWIDVYVINKGTNTSTLFGSTPVNSGQPFLALDIDETTGEIYVLHGSISAPGSTAITVYKYL